MGRIDQYKVGDLLLCYKTPKFRGVTYEKSYPVFRIFQITDYEILNTIVQSREEYPEFAFCIPDVKGTHYWWAAEDIKKFFRKFA